MLNPHARKFPKLQKRQTSLGRYMSWGLFAIFGAGALAGLAASIVGSRHRKHVPNANTATQQAKPNPIHELLY